jgi:hypothetical protein
MRERAQPFLDDPKLVREIIADGNSKARQLARETMRDVREAMGWTTAEHRAASRRTMSDSAMRRSRQRRRPEAA